MANFERLFHWERFAPKLANNRELPEREQLALELATGLSVLELQDFSLAVSKAATVARDSVTVPERPDKDATAEQVDAFVTASRAALEQFRAAQVAALTPLWTPYIRLAPGKHTLDGKPLTSLADYLGAVMQQPGLFNFLELQREVKTLNSVDGTHALFSRALHGGSDSTDDQSSAPESNETGGR